MNSATYEYDFEMGVGALLTWSLTLFKRGMGMYRHRQFQCKRHNFQYALRSIWNSYFGKFLDFCIFARIFSLVQTTLDVDLARCECDIDMDVGALDTLGLTLSKYDMVRFASVALRAEGGAFSLDISPNFKVFFKGPASIQKVRKRQLICTC